MVAVHCQHCTDTRLRPTGTQTRTINGQTHVTAECANWDLSGRQGKPPTPGPYSDTGLGVQSVHDRMQTGRLLQAEALAARVAAGLVDGSIPHDATATLDNATAQLVLDHVQRLLAPDTAAENSQ